MSKRRPPEAYLGGHSVVYANASEKCLTEQAQAHKWSAFEAQAEFERERQKGHDRVQATIENAEREIRERREAQRAVRPARRGRGKRPP